MPQSLELHRAVSAAQEPAQRARPKPAWVFVADNLNIHASEGRRT